MSVSAAAGERYTERQGDTEAEKRRDRDMERDSATEIWRETVRQRYGGRQCDRDI